MGSQSYATLGCDVSSHQTVQRVPWRRLVEELVEEKGVRFMYARAGLGVGNWTATS